MEVQNELYCVEQHDLSCYDNTAESLEFENNLWVKIHRLDNKDNLWYEESSMPLRIGRRSLKVENPEVPIYEYGVGQAAMVKNAICLTIGVKRGLGVRSFRQSHWPKNYEYSNVVLYHPKSRSWELVAQDVPPRSFSDHHKFFEPTF